MAMMYKQALIESHKASERNDPNAFFHLITFPSKKLLLIKTLYDFTISYIRGRCLQHLLLIWS